MSVPNPTRRKPTLITAGPLPPAMTEAAERVAVRCPACAPDGETVHEVLDPGGRATVRCRDCGHVHKTSLPDERTVAASVVVSQSGDSVATRREFPADATVETGDEFVVETDEAVLVARVTDVELPGGRRAESAPAADVETVWTRGVGNVAVNVTVHPAEGSDESSRSETVRVPGDYEFAVDDEETFGDVSFAVETLLLRDDATGYDRGKLDAPGETALAKDLKRLYGRAEGSAWSAW